MSASPLGAHEHVHALGRLRQEHRRLARGIAAADDDDLFAAAQLRLHERRPVVDAGAFELREIVERQPPVLRAGRDDHRRAPGSRVADPMSTAYGLRSQVSRVAPSAITICAPNFCACV